MSYVAETPGCPSRADPAYRLTTAVTSRIPFIAKRSLLLPHPTYELKFTHNNKVVPPYERYAQVITFGQFTVANMHAQGRSRATHEEASHLVYFVFYN